MLKLVGPCAISPAHRLGEVALESGMIVTDGKFTLTHTQL